MERKVLEFLNDTKEYNIFSYDDYKNSSLALRIKKIQLLNEYYMLKYGNSMFKLPVFIDCDGVILNTFSVLREMLLKQCGINLDMHDRENADDENVVVKFFSNLDWNNILINANEINGSKTFVNLIKESNIYTPTIYSAVNTNVEAEQKRIVLGRDLLGVDFRFTSTKFPKKCEDTRSVLIDDDDFNLSSWNGYPIHFNFGRETNFPSINDLGELYYLFPFNENYNMASNINGLYDNYTQVYDHKTKRLKWTKKN